MGMEGNLGIATKPQLSGSPPPPGRGEVGPRECSSGLRQTDSICTSVSPWADCLALTLTPQGLQT